MMAHLTTKAVSVEVFGLDEQDRRHRRRFHHGISRGCHLVHSITGYRDSDRRLPPILHLPPPHRHPQCRHNHLAVCPPSQPTLRRVFLLTAVFFQQRMIFA